MNEKKFIIAVADDDLDDHQLIKQGLKDCKAEVVVEPVYDGIRLMDYLLKRHTYRDSYDTPDLILLDLNMPLMDGFDVLREIRKYGHLRRIPIYVVTTSRHKEDMAKVLELGASGFYSKGSSSKDIRNIVQEICQECFGTLGNS
jgi:CheY-like chemotaxis protein